VQISDTDEWHVKNEAAFFEEAIRLREKYASQIKLVIGFEIDWIRPESLQLIEASRLRLPFEFFVGSVHHVHTIPIDYDTAMYNQARDVSGGTDERLFEDYFDSQLDMLQKLKPLVVGHFDLIRLKSADPNATFTQYPGVWEKIRRNLQFVAGYGGMLELNSAALRKGMSEPYPKGEICKVGQRNRKGKEKRFSVNDYRFRNSYQWVATSACPTTVTASIRWDTATVKC
jgi:histidinol-phosphatase (PHP family)